MTAYLAMPVPNFAGGPQGDAGTSPPCPNCNSKKVWRDRLRFAMFGCIQRWLCRDCGHRFSEPKDVQAAQKTLEEESTIETKELKNGTDIATSRRILFSFSSCLE